MLNHKNSQVLQRILRRRDLSRRHQLPPFLPQWGETLASPFSILLSILYSIFIYYLSIFCYSSFKPKKSTLKLQGPCSLIINYLRWICFDSTESVISTNLVPGNTAIRNGPYSSLKHDKVCLLISRIWIWYQIKMLGEKILICKHTLSLFIRTQRWHFKRISSIHICIKQTLLLTLTIFYPLVPFGLPNSVAFLYIFHNDE